MADRSSKKDKRPRDFNERALQIVKEATGEEGPFEPPEKNPHAVALGRLGGKVGGKVRAQRLSAERRSEIARRAATIRWSKETEGDPGNQDS